MGGGSASRLCLLGMGNIVGNMKESAGYGEYLRSSLSGDNLG